MQDKSIFFSCLFMNIQQFIIIEMCSNKNIDLLIYSINRLIYLVTPSLDIYSDILNIYLDIYNIITREDKKVIDFQDILTFTEKI